MKILLTGATGFVGSVLVPRLLALKYVDTLSVFVLPGEEFSETITSNSVIIYYGDMRDSLSVDNAVKNQDVVIHLAGFISYWRRDTERLRAINIQGVQNVVDACIKHKIQRLVHISSVGSVGFRKDGSLSDETTLYNWPDKFPYMLTKKKGEDIVLDAVKKHNLNAVVLNPASIMGPGDHNSATPHNKLYASIIMHPFFLGSFAGGLAIVDVRDLCDGIVKAIHTGGKGERYLMIGGNLPYHKVIEYIGECAGKSVFPFPIHPILLTLAGFFAENVSLITKKKPLLTAAYGMLSGWFAYYSNEKSVRDLKIKYRDIRETIFDGCNYFKDNFTG